jgi:AraC family transcriptional regulator
MPYSALIPHTRETLLQPWLSASTQKTWDHFQICQYTIPAARIPENWLLRHTIIFNVGAPFSFSARSQGKWKKFNVDSGQVMELSSPGLGDELEFNDECHILALSFDTYFVDQFLETENFSFNQRYKPDDPSLSEILVKLNREIVDGHIAEKLYAESLILSCLVHLISNYASTGKKIFAPRGKLSSKQLTSITEYVHEYVQTNLNLPQLASCVHLSPFHFARLFRQTVGVSPYRYVLQMKIEYAKKLIRQRQVSMSDVAYALSFTDQAHFSNAFKKVTGVCPRQFLQMGVV